LWLVVGLAAVAPVNKANAYEDATLGARVFLWFPNRVLDALDIVRVGIGFGPGIGFEVAATEYAQLGSYYTRETAWAWYGSADNRTWQSHQGTYWTYVLGRKRSESTQGDDKRFMRGMWRKGQADIRAQVAAGFVHPYISIDLMEIADFLVGFTGFDLSKDDMRAENYIGTDPARKLGRGISNALTGILEIPRQVQKTHERHGGMAALTWGTMIGMKQFILREVVGFYEIFTFANGANAVIEPEFPFEPQVYKSEFRIRSGPSRM
jgi:putative exosortase-associated protein (TIGR04073 family)